MLWHTDDFTGPQSVTVRKSHQMMQANQRSGHVKGRMRFLEGEGRVLRGRRRCSVERGVQRGEAVAAGSSRACLLFLLVMLVGARVGTR